MSKYATLVVAVAIGAAMEGCKSSSEEQATNAWKQAEKDMKTVTESPDHEMKACDAAWTKSNPAIDTAELAKMTASNKKDKNYAKNLDACKKQKGFKDKDEKSFEVQGCIEAKAAKAASPKDKTKKSTESKDDKNYEKAVEAFVTQYGQCYAKASDFKTTLKTGDEQLAKLNKIPTYESKKGQKYMSDYVFTTVEPVKVSKKQSPAPVTKDQLIADVESLKKKEEITPELVGKIAGLPQEEQDAVFAKATEAVRPELEQLVADEVEAAKQAEIKARAAEVQKAIAALTAKKEASKKTSKEFMKSLKLDKFSAEEQKQIIDALAKVATQKDKEHPAPKKDMEAEDLKKLIAKAVAEKAAWNKDEDFKFSDELTTEIADLKLTKHDQDELTNAVDEQKTKKVVDAERSAARTAKLDTLSTQLKGVDAETGFTAAMIQEYITEDVSLEESKDMFKSDELQTAFLAKVADEKQKIEAEQARQTALDTLFVQLTQVDKKEDFTGAMVQQYIVLNGPEDPSIDMFKSVELKTDFLAKVAAKKQDIAQQEAQAAARKQRQDEIAALAEKVNAVAEATQFDALVAEFIALNPEEGDELAQFTGKDATLKGEFFTKVRAAKITALAEDVLAVTETANFNEALVKRVTDLKMTPDEVDALKYANDDGALKNDFDAKVAAAMRTIKVEALIAALKTVSEKAASDGSAPVFTEEQVEDFIALKTDGGIEQGAFDTALGASKVAFEQMVAEAEQWAALIADLKTKDAVTILQDGIPAHIATTYNKDAQAEIYASLEEPVAAALKPVVEQEVAALRAAAIQDLRAQLQGFNDHTDDQLAGLDAGAIKGLELSEQEITALQAEIHDDVEAQYGGIRAAFKALCN